MHYQLILQNKSTDTAFKRVKLGSPALSMDFKTGLIYNK